MLNKWLWIWRIIFLPSWKKFSAKKDLEGGTPPSHSFYSIWLSSLWNKRKLPLNFPAFSYISSFNLTISSVTSSPQTHWPSQLMEARGRGAGWRAHHFLPRSKKSSRQENIKIPISKRFHAPMRSGSWWRLLPEPFLQSFSIFLLAWSPSPRGWSIPSQWDTLLVDKDPVGLGLASTDRPTPYTPLQLLLSKLDVLNIQTAGVLSAFY